MSIGKVGRVAKKRTAKAKDYARFCGEHRHPDNAKLHKAVVPDKKFKVKGLRP